MIRYSYLAWFWLPGSVVVNGFPFWRRIEYHAADTIRALSSLELRLSAEYTIGDNTS